MMSRRNFMSLMMAGGAVLLAERSVAMGFLDEKDGGKTPQAGNFPFQLTDAEWKARLSAKQYDVLRRHGTELAWTSPLNAEKRTGTFHCAGCDHPLFSSAHKYDSGTGWPSFYQPLSPDAVGTSTDHKIGYARTEVHCANCGGHLGHVFEDGPEPTGLRYCMNGAALRFKPA